MISIYKILTQSSAFTIVEKNNYEIVKVRKPGEVLSKKDILHISKIISRAKSHIFTKEYIKDQNLITTITSCDTIFAVFANKKFIGCGFATIYKEVDVTYLFSSFVRKTYQKKGIGELLMRQGIETKLFVFLTQTTHSYRLLQRISLDRTLYPNIQEAKIPEHIFKKLQPIIPKLPGSYNPQTSSVLLTSGYSSFAAMPLSQEKKLNQWMYEKLYKDRKQGEEQLFFCVGEVL